MAYLQSTLETAKALWQSTGLTGAEQARLEAEKQQLKLEKSQRKGTGRKRQSAAEAMVKSAARSIGSQLGRQIIRGVLGSFFGKR